MKRQYEYQQNEQLPLTLTHWTQKNTTTYDVGNLVLAWDRNNNVAGLNRSMGCTQRLLL
jgi:hypothetical protein